MTEVEEAYAGVICMARAEIIYHDENVVIYTFPDTHEITIVTNLAESEYEPSTTARGIKDSVEQFMRHAHPSSIGSYREGIETIVYEAAQNFDLFSNERTAYPHWLDGMAKRIKEEQSDALEEVERKYND